MCLVCSYRQWYFESNCNCKALNNITESTKIEYFTAYCSNNFLHTNFFIYSYYLSGFILYTLPLMCCYLSVVSYISNMFHRSTRLDEHNVCVTNIHIMQCTKKKKRGRNEKHISKNTSIIQNTEITISVKQ